MYFSVHTRFLRNFYYFACTNLKTWKHCLCYEISECFCFEVVGKPPVPKKQSEANFQGSNQKHFFILESQSFVEDFEKWTFWPVWSVSVDYWTFNASKHGRSRIFRKECLLWLLVVNHKSVVTFLQRYHMLVIHRRTCMTRCLFVVGFF